MNYKKGWGNFHERFLKIDVFAVGLHFGDGEGESGKLYLLYTCENVDNYE